MAKIGITEKDDVMDREGFEIRSEEYFDELI
jgi:hypothetical protein